MVIDPPREKPMTLKVSAHQLSGDELAAKSSCKVSKREVCGTWGVEV
jgi:hypothetical protein